MPRRRAGVVPVRIDAELLIVDEPEAGLHHLDPVATALWDRLDGDRSLVEIAEDLAAAYGAPLSTVLADVTSLVETLRAQGLVEIASP